MQHRWQYGLSMMIGLGVIGAALFALAPISSASSALRQATLAPSVWVEAVGQANLRGGPGMSYRVVGEIAAGTRYHVLAQHSLVPWLLIEYPGITGSGWVYRDLVTVTGDLGLIPPITAFETVFPPTPTAAITPAAPVTAAPATLPPGVSPLPGAPQAQTTSPATDAPTSATPANTLSPTPSATPTLTGPTATTLGEANIRFGPDVEYPVVVQVPAGSTFRVLEVHSLVPWLRIEVPESPTGDGWLFNDVVQITGDLSGVPRTTIQQVSYPTLTPTPQTVVVNGAPWTSTPPTGQLAAALGQQIHEFLLVQNFVPYTTRFGSVFVLDLQTGDTFTVNDNIAYSGMSLTKIAILATYFKQQRGTLSRDEAFLVADTMMCSENITTNDLLALIGEGDALRGAQRVTIFLQGLDLRGTFIMRQYRLNENEPEIGVGTITTGADQNSARPDLYNQVVPKDLGFLLAGIYQCAQNETGLLMERYPQDFDALKCRKMLYAMDTNQIGVFLEAGVPANAVVIHKHGWVEDTHGDAGIIIAPDGSAYIVVTALYGRDWLEFDQSAPVIGEVSRLVWNYFHPESPVEAVASAVVPAECDPSNDPIMQALMAAELPMLVPTATPAP